MLAASATRTELLVADLPSRALTQVHAHDIVFRPGETSSPHTHASPVFGYIVQGQALLEIAGQRPQVLPQGSAFFEPADTLILRFDNASQSEPLQFVAFYFLNGKQEFMHMLSSPQ